MSTPTNSGKNHENEDSSPEFKMPTKAERDAWEETLEPGYQLPKVRPRPAPNSLTVLPTH